MFDNTLLCSLCFTINSLSLYILLYGRLIYIRYGIVYDTAQVTNKNTYRVSIENDKAYYI